MKVFTLLLLILMLGTFVPTVFAQYSGNFTIRIVAPQGGPLPRANQIYISDLQYRPKAVVGELVTEKTFTNLPLNTPLMISSYLEVPGFGNLDFTAFAGGEGFLPDGRTIDVVFEIARHRYLVTNNLIQQNNLDSVYVSRLDQAKALLDQATNSSPGTVEQASFAMQSLQLSAPLSEEVVIAKNKQTLENKGKLLPDQYLSVFTYYAQREGDRFFQYANPIFTRGVAYLQWQYQTTGPDQFTWPNDTEMSKQTSFSTTRMSPGIWLNNLPSWITASRDSLPTIKDQLVKFMSETAQRYPKFRVWQVLSEPHSWDDQGFITAENLIDITKAVIAAVKQVKPQDQVGINTALAWGEDAASNLTRTPKVYSPYEFYDLLNRNNVNYDFLVLQLYPSGRDMFEHEQLLNTFKNLGKNIHVELSAPSRNNAMSGSSRPEFCQGTADCRHPSQKYYSWHGDWSETNQAKWAEDMFYVLMSKDYVKEYNWWDLADYTDVYIPWGGLLDSNYQPKPAYSTLKTLARKYARFPFAGDLDNNGKVDIFDYNILVANFGKTGENNADINLDSKVDIFDYNVLVANFGKN